MIKIYVACAPDGLDAEAQMVLDYSIRKFTTVDYEIIWLQDSEDEDSPLFNWNMDTWETPFCGFRWAVPELSNFEGESLYLDFNHIILSDLAEISQIDWKNDAVLMTTKNNPLSIIKFNNRKIQKYLPLIEEMAISSSSHSICARYFLENKKLIQYIPGDWGPDPSNTLEDLAYKNAIYYEDLHNMYLKPIGYSRLNENCIDHWFNIYVDKTRKPNFDCEVFGEYYHEALNNNFKIEKYTDVFN
jgi:hypothetical protein